jgi:hypothetical protein
MPNGLYCFTQRLSQNSGAIAIMLEQIKSHALCRLWSYSRQNA